MIEFRGVTKRFEETAALREITLTMQAHRTCVLLGTSGCGKSTLLKLMLGLLKPSSGEILFDGQSIASQSLLALRRRVGYVIQEGGLFPHLTAAENAALVSRYLGWSAEKIRSRLDELARLVQLPREMLDRPPGKLSGGQQQRVALMRALMLDPPVLLLDEPLGALDPIIRSELQDDLRKIFRQLRKTVVMVTHDLNEAAFFADTIVLLNHGEIEQQGSIEELIRSPATEFVSRFVNAQRSELPEVNS